MAWDFLTKELAISEDRLFVTFFASSVFAGTLVINSNQSDPRANEVMHAYIKAFDEAHPDITVVVNDFDTE